MISSNLIHFSLPRKGYFVVALLFSTQFAWSQPRSLNLSFDDNLLLWRVDLGMFLVTVYRVNKQFVKRKSWQKYSLYTPGRIRTYILSRKASQRIEETVDKSQVSMLRKWTPPASADRFQYRGSARLEEMTLPRPRLRGGGLIEGYGPPGCCLKYSQSWCGL